MVKGERQRDWSTRLFRIIAYAVQFFFGGWFFYNGLNHFVGFTPPPPGSSPATRELMAGLEQTGLFAVVKAIELLTGAALLANRFVPLAALVAFPVTFAIAWVMTVINGGAVGYTVGVLALLFNAIIALSRWEHFAPVLAVSDRGPRLPQFHVAKKSRAERGALWTGGLGPVTHVIGAIAGVGLSAGIELGTMAYFQSVAHGPEAARPLSGEEG